MRSSLLEGEEEEAASWGEEAAGVGPARKAEGVRRPAAGPRLRVSSVGRKPLLLTHGVQRKLPMDAAHLEKARRLCNLLHEQDNFWRNKSNPECNF